MSASCSALAVVRSWVDSMRQLDFGETLMRASLRLHYLSCKAHFCVETDIAKVNYGWISRMQFLDYLIITTNRL
jgi:hypothetical protein